MQKPGEGAVIVNSRKPSWIRSGDDSLVFKFNLQLSTLKFPNPPRPFIHHFLAPSEAEGYAKSPTNSFIYRFYAKFASKSFIYRFYAFAPGCGGHPLQLSTFNCRLSTSASSLCVNSALSALACAGRSLPYHFGPASLSTVNCRLSTSSRKHKTEPYRKITTITHQ